MRRLCAWSALVVLMVVPGCWNDTFVPADESLQSIATQVVPMDVEELGRTLVTQAGWPLELDASESAKSSGQATSPLIQCWQRQVVDGDIVHYSLRVKVGFGPYDFIGLHRVVRERFPNVPIRTRKSVFLQHGDIKDFTGMFLPGVTSPTIPDDFGLAVFLARAGLDVWGIDQSWSIVPPGVTDFNFMANWGMDRCIADLRTGLEIARVARRLTGNGNERMPLLGYSSGAALGFAYVNDEAGLPRGLRQVSAYIPVDYGLVTNDPAWEQTGCEDLAFLQDMLDAGTYQFDNPFVVFGPPARDDPGGPSAAIPGFTNLQAALFLATIPAYAVHSYHYLAGTFDSDGLPTGLQYTQIGMWIDFMCSAPPYEAAAFMRDYSLASCPSHDVPWDDHLGQISVPILYVLAEGGAGPGFVYTLDQAGSSDKTILRIGLHPPEEALLDYGHIDLFIADNAPALVWQPILDWLEARYPAHPSFRGAFSD
jgi:hypothetical protein